MFSLLFYVYDTVCHEIFIAIHSLMYRLGNREAIISIALDYDKAVVLMRLCYQRINRHIYR